MNRRFPLVSLLVGALGLGALGASAAKEARLPAGSETVVATYRAQPGKEAELEKLVSEHWPLCRKLGLALDRPHLVLKGTDESKKTIFVEVMTWKDTDAPDSAPPELRRLWDRMQALVEPRLGHRGIEHPEAEVLALDPCEEKKP
jgi:hypothetical protein